MIKEPATKVNIDGKFTSFNSIKLIQKTNNHHEFKVILDNDTTETVGTHTIDKSKDWLGKPLMITFDEMEFLGTITNISLYNKDGHRGSLIIKGYSPTILLQGQPHYTSWTNKTLQNIVTDSLETLELGKQILPTFKEPLEYQAQYNENHFQFLQRLAKQYNQWFYYDGVSIIFGKPKFDNNPIYIEYGADIDNLQLKIHVKDHKQNKLSYDASQNNYLSASSKDKVTGLNELGLHAFNTSKSIFKAKTHTLPDIKANSKYLIDSYVEQQQAQASANLHILKGKSTKRGLTVGTVIKVKSAKINGKADVDIQNYGEYVITNIIHKATHNNHYTNTFTAIPSGIVVPKAPKVKLPKAQPQTAIVTDNADSQGRVKVRFQWQTNSQQTAWLRVMSNNAGSSDHHEQNRGQVFIPEIGDQVMVGFEHNNPNAPFVLGSLFHGENGAGGKTNNNIKSIITKSGNEVIFNDGDGKGSIHLNAPSGNNVHLNGDGSITVFNTSGNCMLMDNAGNIDVTAPNHITFNSKKVTFNVANKMQLNVMQKMMVNTPWLMQLITEFYHTQVGKALLTSENEIKIESPELFAIGQKKLFLHSDELATLNSKGVAEFKGDKGNKHTNIAEEYEIVAPEIEAKAVVNFRPYSAWAGEFGFDWMRKADTSIAGDVDYKANVGSYGAIYATKPEAVFTPGNYPALESKYNPINITGKTDALGNQLKYYTSWLSIYRAPNSATPPFAKLELQVDVEIEPDEIYIEYPKKYFEIAGATESKTDTSLMQVKLPASTHAVTTGTPHKTNITIKCIHTLELNKVIKVWAVKNKVDGTAGEPKLAGRLKVKANSKEHRRVANIVFVNVITNINDYPLGREKHGIFAPDKIAQETYLIPFLQQALVNPKVVNKDFDLYDSTKANTQTLNRNYTLTRGSSKIFNKYHNTGGDNLATFLEKQFDADPVNAIYKQHYKVFFLGERGGRMNDTSFVGLGGYANGIQSKECVMFANPDKFFVAHELMHCMGLYHSFDNDGEHTFAIGQTENIMDYSHMTRYARPNGVLTQMSTWAWQWTTLISNNELEL